MKTNDDFLNTLLKSDEGINIDFKEKINIDTDAGKAKFIKIFLALANSPIKPSMIVLGIEDKPSVKGGIRKVIGVQEDVYEERLQSLVNSYCTPPISFTYKQIEHPDGFVGIINIIGHRRPYTPKEKYVKLLPEKEKQSISEKSVFIRHGSTTDTAHPDEIMEMERERLSQDKESFHETLDEVSDISSSLSHIRWSLERIESQKDKDNPLGYAVVGILSGLLIDYLISLSWSVSLLSFYVLTVPVCVSIILSSLRIVRIGFVRSVIIGLAIGLTFGILSGITDSVFYTKLEMASTPLIAFMLWGGVKGIVSSTSAMLIASKFGFNDF